MTTEYLGKWRDIQEQKPGFDPPLGSSITELELWDYVNKRRKTLQFGRPYENKCLQWFCWEQYPCLEGAKIEPASIEQILQQGSYTHWRFFVPPLLKYDPKQKRPCSKFTPCNYPFTFMFNSASCNG